MSLKAWIDRWAKERGGKGHVDCDEDSFSGLPDIFRITRGKKEYFDYRTRFILRVSFILKPIFCALNWRNGNVSFFSRDKRGMISYET